MSLVQTIKTALRPLVPQSLLNKRVADSNQKLYDIWLKNGKKDPPPPLVKHGIIAEYQKSSGYQLLIETGTFLGDMVEAQKKTFKKIYSIEIGEDLHKRAKRRFRNDSNVELLLGDSSKVLPQILAKINAPAVFWLDGHYSGGITSLGDKVCPILGELDAIFDAKFYPHVILVDDARLFVGKEDYPTIDELVAYMRTKNANYKVTIENDVIRFVL